MWLTDIRWTRATVIADWVIVCGSAAIIVAIVVGWIQ